MQEPSWTLSRKATLQKPVHVRQRRQTETNEIRSYNPDPYTGIYLETTDLLVERGPGFRSDDCEFNELDFAATRGDTKMLEFLVREYEEKGTH